MTQPIQNYEVTGERAKEAYDVMVDALIRAHFSKPEATVGALAVLAAQFADGQVTQEQLSDFIKEASEWMILYWTPKDETLQAS